MEINQKTKLASAFGKEDQELMASPSYMRLCHKEKRREKERGEERVQALARQLLKLQLC